MKEKLETFIGEFITCYNEKPSIGAAWGEPVFAYADAKDEKFLQLKDIIGPYHKLPSDFMPDGKTVITYFVPLSKAISDSNIEGYYSSPEWAAAYLATIDLIKAIEKGLIHYFDISGWKVERTADNRSWDPKTMQCDWSHRHAAAIAGLGTFGMNRGLITEKGVCGRIGTMITDAYIEPTKIPEMEACLAKRNGGCGICIQACPVKALDAIGNYDNKKCLAMTVENAEHHKGLDYADVCGKCMSGMPCSVERP